MFHVLSTVGYIILLILCTFLGFLAGVAAVDPKVERVD